MPRDNRLFTLFLSLAVCLHIVKLHVCMLWLTMILQKPAIARRTIAIELLRRSDQMENDRRRAQSIPAPQSRVGQSPARSPRSKQTRCHSNTFWRGASTMARQLPQPLPSEASATNLLATSNSLHSLRPKRLRLNIQAGLYATLRQSSTRSPLHVPQIVSAATSEDAQDIEEPQIQAESKETELSVGTGAQLTPPVSPTKARLPYARFGGTHEYRPTPGGQQSKAREQKLTVDSCYTPLLSDIDSAGSDATPVENNYSSYLRTSSTTIDVQDDATEGAKEDDLDSPNHTVIDATEVLNGTIESRTNKRWSTFSMDSVSTIIRKSSPVTRRVRSKTNGGLLEFRASTTGPREPPPIRIHRRILSLNLPIRPNSLPGCLQLTQNLPPASIAPAPRFSDDEASAATQIESELQYKQRHIFVGTASLHHFLEILETSSPGITTKPAVLKTFTALAAKEQLMARRNSLSPNDWTLVTRITADISDFDYLVLARVQLGSISLQQFVDSIPFDVFEEAPLMAVVEAFKIASHMDAAEARNRGSKARAFRDLVLSQSSTVGSY